MRKASVHFKPVKGTSEQHNNREKDYDYIDSSRTKDNKSWSEISIVDKRIEIEKRYKESVGQKMQAKSVPIREGVIVLQEHHTIDDVAKVTNSIAKEFGIHCFQIHIHRDEGKMNKETGRVELNENGTPKINYHGHVLFDWTNEKGKSVKLQKQDLSRIQDIVSEELQMERGVPATESKRRHLDPIQYKATMDLQKIGLTIAKSNEFLKVLQEESDHSDQVIKDNNMIPTNALGVVNKLQVKEHMKNLIEMVNRISQQQKGKEERAKKRHDMEISSLQRKYDKLQAAFKKTQTDLSNNLKAVKAFVSARKGDPEAIKHADYVCDQYAKFDLEKQKQQQRKRDKGTGFNR